MNEFKAIVCIMNEGYIDDALDEAKRLGAKGGTVIKARGTAPKQAESIYNIVIQPEKEILLMVVANELVDPILNALYVKVGTDTPAMGIAFAMPVDNEVGITK